MKFPAPFRALTIVSLITLTTLVNSPIVGQDAPVLEEHQKSVLLFDVRLNEIWEAASAIGSSDDEVNAIPLDDMFQGIKLTDFKRAFGSASLPKNMATIMALQPDSDVPVEFFVRVEFTTSKAADRLESNLKERSDSIKLAGKTFFLDPTGPKNLVAHRSGENSIEMGTKSYCLQANRSFHTERLKLAFSKAPKDPIRMVIDLESRSDLVKEGMAAGKEMAPPPMQAFIDLADNANWIYLTASFTGENMLTLVAEGKDEEQAEELRSGLDALLGMAKMGAQLGVKQMTKEVPAAAEVAQQIFASLAANRTGNEVHIRIPRPDGLASAINEARERAISQAAKMSEMNAFRALALGALNYESANRRFPFTVDERAGHSTELSWRVRILPFIEENEMYQQMDMKKGPEEEPNRQFANQMPSLFGADGKHANVAWIQSDVTSFREIRDGSSNTIMLIELPQGRPWMANQPLTIDEAVQLVSELKDAELNTSFYDGSTRTISSGIDETTLRHLFDPNDGNIIDWDQIKSP